MTSTYRHTQPKIGSQPKVIGGVNGLGGDVEISNHALSRVIGWPDRRSYSLRGNHDHERYVAVGKLQHTGAGDDWTVVAFQCGIDFIADVLGR